MDRLTRVFPKKFSYTFAAAVLMLADAAALIASLGLSAMLRYERYSAIVVYQTYIRPHMLSSLVALGVYICIFSVYRLYAYAWRFAGLDTLKRLVLANILGLCALIVIQTVIDGSTFSLAVLTLILITSTVMIGTIRILLRLLSVGQKYGSRVMDLLKSDKVVKRVIVLGTESHSVRVLGAIREDMSARYKVVGFLDDNPDVKGLYIGDVKILGSTNRLQSMLDEHMVDEVIIALPETSSEQIRSYVLECRRRQMPVKVVSLIRDMLNRETALHLHEFTVEDLLRRPSVGADTLAASDYLNQKRVMVTGAGGSIGSELCRQIAVHNPKSLILFGHGENSIHGIYQELRSDFPNLADRIHCVIASIANEFRVNQTMELYNPEIVFHAAAHKHVPLMELNEQEAVHNNVIGTTNVAEAAGRYGVERLVLISTDKAADPSSVMGASKWLCEQSTRVAAVNWPDTKYITVRFGNVLGSRGSVVPIFHEQIKRGGPVTVTHPEMTRFFMTIPEAVLLVIKAGCVGRSGELYLLDMGQPVRILDLARDMIRLCGLEPDVDIAIEFCGIRDGEKLHEHLISNLERIGPTPWNGLSIVNRPNYFDPTEFRTALEHLDRAARFGTPAEVRAVMRRLIPGYSSPSEDWPQEGPTQIVVSQRTDARKPSENEEGVVRSTNRD